MRIYIGIMPDNENQECSLEIHRNTGTTKEPDMRHVATLPIGVSHISQVLEIQEDDIIRFRHVKE